MKILVTLALTVALAAGPAGAESPSPPAAPVYDAALAQKLGADDYGMRSYVLVILRTGPTPMPKGPERDAMFKGHFANMERLAAEGRLVIAGPFGQPAGDWRGLFIFDVKTIDEAKALTETDPVIKSGEMLAEYHPWYGSAALKLVNEAHSKVQKKGS